MASPDAPTSVDVGNIEAVASGPAFEAALESLVRATGRDPDELRREAVACLREMGTAVSVLGTGAWDRFGSWLARAYTIDAGDAMLPGGRLDRLRELGSQSCLVFLPNHRSYLDPLVLRRLLRRAGFPPNFVLGGVNLAVWPFSTIAKHAGLVFIRRGTRQDAVYPAMMRLYLAHLVASRAHLEWYFEGGRTRTGKLRPPKLGVLRYLVDALGPGGGPGPAPPAGTPPAPADVYVVPVAIVYDQQAEVMAISAEEAGAAKPPESLRWLAGFARAQSRRRGSVHVRFGDPMSLHGAVRQAREASDADPRNLVPRVAFDIANRINAATPVTAAALLTFALLGNGGRALTLAECNQVVQPFLAYVRRRGLDVTSISDLTGPEGLLPALTTLQRAGVVQCYSGGLEPVYSVATERWHEAAFYRNTVAHYFVTRAIVELAVVAVVVPDTAAHPIRTEELVARVWAEALALRDLLKYEFFFPSRDAFAALARAEAELAHPGWESERLGPAELGKGLAATGMLISHRIIGPFLEAYLVLADLLATEPVDRRVDEPALTARGIAVAKQRWLQQEIGSPESISKELMTNAVALAGNRNLLGVGGAELKRARRAFAAELADVVRRVGVVREASLAHLRQDVLPSAADGSAVEVADEVADAADSAR
jgi:glycerol-3-phosphate O-acyltransferase